MINLPFFSFSKPESDGLEPSLPRAFQTGPVVLLVLDGWGLAPPGEGNAIARAKTPVMDGLPKTYPAGELIASGESVGLPANEVGNTEVGHLNMGAGRVINQSLKRINIAIEDGSFFDNQSLIAAIQHAKQNNSKLHILGLTGSGKVHSSIDHLMAIVQLIRVQELTKNVYYHLFTDGRDAPPKGGLNVVKKIEEQLVSSNAGRIASISGRYFAMDRDLRWDRTQKAFETIVHGQGPKAKTASEAIEAAYAANQTDEFIEPTVITSGEEAPVQMKDNDAIIFLNFRIDRPRQLAAALSIPNFEHIKKIDFGYNPALEKSRGEVAFTRTFNRGSMPKNLHINTMTLYAKTIPVSGVAFPPEQVKNSLAVLIANHKLKQMHISESEKERFVTVYFDGLREQPQEGEDKSIVGSPKVATYDQKPEMSVFKVSKEIKKALSKKKHHFVIANFANADMVGHTGNMSATLKAIEAVDKAIGEVVDTVKTVDGTLIVTADHGNAEELISYKAQTFFYTTHEGDVSTDHSNNPVPVIVVSGKLEGKQFVLPRGQLVDIAPTVLALLGLPKGDEMTGNNLLEKVVKSSTQK